MITRTTAAARRRRLQHQIAASFAQLNLPWLAPAQLRWVASQTGSTSLPSHRTRRKSTGRAGRLTEPSRNLATAAEVHSVSSDYTPLLNQEQSQWHWNTGAQLPTIPPTSKLVIPTELPPVAFKSLRVQLGISGSIPELLQHLHTNLRVGRMQRARAIVTRLATESALNGPEVSYAHKLYLEEMVRRLTMLNPKSKEAKTALEEMQAWFEKEVQEAGVKVDAHILVPMIRAAIFAMEGKSRDEAIEDYVSIASALGDDVYDDVIYAEDYTDQEFSILTQTTGEQIDEDLQTQLEHSIAESELFQPPPDVTPETQIPRPDVLNLDETAAVRPTAQRGLGLDGLKQIFEPVLHLPFAKDASAEQTKAEAIARQRMLEEMSAEVAVAQWRKADEELRKIGINTSTQTKPVGALIWQWYSALVPVLQEELEQCRQYLVQKKAHANDRSHYGTYLELLPLEKIAANTIMYILTTLTSVRANAGGPNAAKGVTISQLAVGIGKTVEAEANAHAEMEKKKGRSTVARAARARRQRKTAKSQNISVEEHLTQKIAWSMDVKVTLGSMLLAKTIETAQLPVTREHPRTKEKVTQMQPAFLHQFAYLRGRRSATLSANPALLSKLQAEPVASLVAKRMPMVVEPRSWSGWNKGAYYYYKNPIMRLGHGERQGREYFHAADKQGDLGQVYAGLNALSKVPWRVNHDVFKVQLEAWNSGEAIANLAPLHPRFDIPPEPEPSADPEPRRKWLVLLRDAEDQRSAYHSQRCFQNFQLETARSMANETLYFPHSLDFRGRAYPIPPYLNHMGADNVRALLVFAKGKELGVEGLRWLKIHLANVAGYDKASLQEREDYTMDHLDDIRDSVNDPLGGRKWWLKSEDAWQTLAACYELVHALDSPDPTKYVSHLPIHQDGTCNGLQHYAALGGDKAGALHVNLEPGDRPADIYAGVAKAVIAEVDKDAEAGNPVAKFLQGHISRKVVKQPVMTNVYGVTFFGAVAQVRKQLEDIFPNVKRYDKVNHGQMSSYIAEKIFKSLGTMFTGAQAIQNWLGECADMISTCVTPEQVEQLTNQTIDEQEKSDKVLMKDDKGRPKTVAELRQNPTAKTARAPVDAKPLFRSTVVWTTPLRLPVVQPYRTAKTKAIITTLQAIAVQEPQTWDPVSRRKQLQAFPPNFIHSLDATHMLLSAEKCNEAGLTFASIHDSFWTHACDVSKMSTVLRDAFVAMHSEDIIGRLLEEFQARYAGHMTYASVPSEHDAGKKIIQWRRKHLATLTTPYAELALEAKRARLLQSENEAERLEGQQMITPSSIMESYAPSDFQKPAAYLGDSSLGAIPAAGTAADESFIEQEEPVPTKARSVSKAYYWRPLTFPPVPKKGDFDVKRLRESKYFFH